MLHSPPMTPPTSLSAFVHPYRKPLAKTLERIATYQLAIDACRGAGRSKLRERSQHLRTLDRTRLGDIGNRCDRIRWATAHDTQRIKEMYDVNDDGTISGRKAVMGALRLYLDFINLFLMLLRIFGNRR
jgi:hypothetical protein